MYTLSFIVSEENKPKLIELLKGLEPIEVGNCVNVEEYTTLANEAEKKVNEIENLIECEGTYFFDEQEGEPLDDYIDGKYFY